VPKTKWPVSAVSIAMAMVSKSRISPTRTISGSSRNAARSARLKAFGVNVDFALVDEAIDILVNKFDWIFNGDDMVVAVFVDEVNHRRQRGRFAASCRAGDNN
jgi:hypothetical protein